MSESILFLDPAKPLDDDAALVLAAQRDPLEFKRLYSKWLKPVYRYFYFRVGSVADAEDLTSQVFLRAYEDLPRYRGRSSFSAWLFSIAHARAVDFYRKGGREVSLDSLDQLPSSVDPLTQASRADEVRQAFCLLRSLSDEEQELLRLRFMADLSYREIGQVLHRSEDAVRKALTRLLSRLQTQMEVSHAPTN